MSSLERKLSFDDDSLERDLFRARARSMELPSLSPPLPPLPSASSVMARGEARKCVQAVLPVGAFARVYKAVSSTVAPVAMLHAAAGLFVIIGMAQGFGSPFARAERVESITGEPASSVTTLTNMMSMSEPGGERGTCSALDSQASCDGPAQSVLIASANENACVGDAICGEPARSPCGDFVTCVDDRP